MNRRISFTPVSLTLLSDLRAVSILYLSRRPSQISTVEVWTVTHSLAFLVLFYYFSELIINTAIKACQVAKKGEILE